MLDLPLAEVHVWLVPATAETAAAVEPVLDDDERARAARLVSGPVRDRSVAAQGALRVLLARYLDTDPPALRFHAQPGGKPALAELPDQPFFECNLSHSGSLVAIAVATAMRPVGVDVEQRRPVHGEEGVARRVMTADELARYHALGHDERVDFLLWVWARKEALVKASGRGMRTSFAGLSCEPAADDPWAVVDLDVPGYAAAVAAGGHDWVPVVRSFPRFWEEESTL